MTTQQDNRTETRAAIRTRYAGPTLSDFRPNKPAVAVFAEFRGRRYFLRTVSNFPDAASVAEAFKHDLPRASLFCADVFDSTAIDGLACDLRNAYGRAGQ